MVKTQLEDFDGVNGWIDCYISTDRDEFGDYIIPEAGYEVLGWGSEDRDRVKGISGLNIFCWNVPLDEALRCSNWCGFIPMSKIRIFPNRTKSFSRSFDPIRRQIEEQRQNMALVDETGSRIYVQLSEFYR